MKDVYLILSHRYTASLTDHYGAIKSSVDGDTFVLFHKKDNMIQLPEDFKIFTDHILNVYPCIGNSLLPGNNHLPLIEFFVQNPEYRNYWMIEDDVRFTGNWNELFTFYENNEADFLTCLVRSLWDDPIWPYWNWIKNPIMVFPKMLRVASFNPIYRLSNQALQFLTKELVFKNWVGHHEVLLPSLLNSRGYSIVDLKKFYIASRAINGNYFNGTIRYRPIFPKVGHIKNKIYHPVKY